MQARLCFEITSTTFCLSSILASQSNKSIFVFLYTLYQILLLRVTKNNVIWQNKKSACPVQILIPETFFVPRFCAAQKNVPHPLSLRPRTNINSALSLNCACWISRNEEKSSKRMQERSTSTTFQLQQRFFCNGFKHSRYNYAYYYMVELKQKHIWCIWYDKSIPSIIINAVSHSFMYFYCFNI
jgi:hypothetical protein